MHRSLQRTSAVLVIAAYIVAGTLLEISHHDVIVASFRGNPVIASHDCGNKETNVPIDLVHRCPACTQSTQRLSTEAAQVFIPNNSLVWVATANKSHYKLPTVDILHSGKRGPPIASV